MSRQRHSSAPESSAGLPTAWDPGRPFGSGSLASAVSRARVVSIGESAHFVAEFNDARAHLVASLVRDHATRDLALEVGSDEAPSIQAWLRRQGAAELRTSVGTLTYALYGSFLSTLREELPTGHEVRIHGVDLPNSLTLEPTLHPLANLLDAIDPNSKDRVAAIRRIASRVVGGSAAASSTSWLELDAIDQATLTVGLARLRARVDAIGTAHGAGEHAEAWTRARDLAETAQTTDLMLRAMADLFSGIGSVDDTTIREHFVARRISAVLDSLGEGVGKLAYVAHNNHIQKTPVVFDGVLTAYPAGSLLAGALGDAYVAIALSHRDDGVPEMVFPAATDVGFRVERVDAAPLRADSLEGLAADANATRGVSLITRSDMVALPHRFAIRSQSEMAEVSGDTFDAALVFATATSDGVIEEAGL